VAVEVGDCGAIKVMGLVASGRWSNYLTYGDASATHNDGRQNGTCLKLQEVRSTLQELTSEAWLALPFGQ
jgi:hypothetical protein